MLGEEEVKELRPGMLEVSADFGIITIMSQELKSTKMRRTRGWKMTTGGDSGFGRFRENEGGQEAVMREEGHLVQAGRYVGCGKKNSQPLTGLHRRWCPQRSYRFS